MGIVAAWELLATDDLGPGEDEGTRRYRISTVAESPDGTLRFVQTVTDLTPGQLQRWERSMDGKRVQP